jgi:ribosomal protein L7Ae-like RNA K-turn-binding protein
MTEENTRVQADKLIALLGLARRAGRLGMGFSAVEKMVVKGENPLVVTTSDMGDSLKMKVSRWQPVRGVVSGVLTGEEMARALGRDKLAVVGVSDSGFVKGIRKLGL